LPTFLHTEYKSSWEDHGFAHRKERPNLLITDVITVGFEYEHRHYRAVSKIVGQNTVEYDSWCFLPMAWWEQEEANIQKWTRTQPAQWTLIYINLPSSVA